MKLAKCKNCRAAFEKRSMTHKACSVACAVELGRIERERLTKRETKAKLAKLKTRSQWLKDAQQAFNKFIRWRDRDKPCISGGGYGTESRGGRMDAGHYRSTGAAPHLRFNEDNCHAQSKKHNRYLAGNAVDYRVGLVERIGLERVEALEADNEPRKWTIDELKAIKADYTNRLKGAS